MKGWIRLGIVLSVLWLIGVPTYHGLILRSGTTDAMVPCKPNPNSSTAERLLNTRQCIQGIEQAEQLKRRFMERDWFTIMLYPVAALWIVGIIAIIIGAGYGAASPNDLRGLSPFRLAGLLEPLVVA